MQPTSLLRRIVLCSTLAAATLAGAQGQSGDDPAISLPDGKALHGTVLPGNTADRLSLRDDDDGGTFTVLVTPNTRTVRSRMPIRPAELKVGETILAFGIFDAPNRSLHALFVSVIDPAELKRARENLGKTYITGTVLAINDLKLTVKRPDGVRQVIAVDETTSFRRGGRRAADAGLNSLSDTDPSNAGELATLADVRPGSPVFGTGALKNGTFVPTLLHIGEPHPPHTGSRSTASRDPAAKEPAAQEPGAPR